MTELLTIIDLRTGKTRTVTEDEAARDLAFGTAIETVPEDAARADAWREAISERIVESLEAKYDGHIGRKPDVLAELLDAKHDYEVWCRNHRLPAFPASISIATRYLLSKVVNGEIEQHDVSRRAFLIGKLHSETKHPPKGLGEATFNAYHRAIAFAKVSLRREVKNIHSHQAAAPAKALEMFPDGDVPRHLNAA